LSNPTINQELQRVLAAYESRAFQQGQDLTRQYFVNLAKGFGLKLQLEFRN